MILFSIFFGILFLLITFFFAFMPYFTRKTESFGVTIPEEMFDNKDVKKVRRFHRNGVIISGLLLLLPFVFISIRFPMSLNILTGFLILFELIVFFSFYLNGHFKMKKLKKSTDDKKEFIIAPLKEERISSPFGFILYFVIMIITIAIGFSFYDKMPSEITLRWDINFKPSFVVKKSYFLVLFPVIMQIILSMIFILVYYIIRKARFEIDPSKPEESMERSRIFKESWANFTIISGFLMLFIFFLMELSFIIEFSPIFLISLVIGITSIIIGMSIYLSVKVGQGGSRLKIGKGKGDEKLISRDADRYWKLGVFYFNPHDPAVFVEKRFGIGWTCNWARPLSWLILIGIFLIIGIAILFSFLWLK